MSASVPEPDDFIDIDLSVLLRKDPRDEVLATLLYDMPYPLDVRSQINGLLGLPPGFEQSVLSELISNGLVASNENGDVRFTDLGRDLAEKRLEKQPTWADYDLRDGAPPLPEMSVRLNLAIKSMAFQHPSLLSRFLA